uniref:Uncharacterized protein n=1 Tax=Amphimedon queenslandica TaxID=400682 RepID=A0A1X7U7L0_AMPQE
MKSLCQISSDPFEKLVVCPSCHHIYRFDDCFQVVAGKRVPHHSPYSVGAIYLAVQNLPRSERYKMENLLLVGIIPGPTEPSLNVNTYLELLVDELNQLFFEGIYVESDTSQGARVLVKGALMLVSCDIPAARKVRGFLGHAAKLGCSKCLKSFETGGHVQYAGFEDAPLRTETSHHPMHNLFLGTAKHMMKNIWLADSDGRNALVTTRDLEIIQNRVDLCVVPSFFGRIPRKIVSKFCNFKADQWKSWTQFFSCMHFITS